MAQEKIETGILNLLGQGLFLLLCFSYSAQHYVLDETDAVSIVLI